RRRCRLAAGDPAADGGVGGGATVEGVNVGGLLLGYLAVLVFGIASVVALGLCIARLTRAARIVFASGLLGATLIAALAALSFLQREFHPQGNKALIVLAALTLLLAGLGQFVAALRSPRTYAAALGCAAASLAFLSAPVLGTEVLGTPVVHQVLGARSLSLPGVSLGLALSLLLAVLT